MWLGHGAMGASSFTIRAGEQVRLCLAREQVLTSGYLVQ
jgi:hypothetical protein